MSVVTSNNRQCKEPDVRREAWMNNNNIDNNNNNNNNNKTGI